MAMDLGANYELTSNIDFSSGLAVAGKYPGMWSSSGFSPIGDPSLQFTGGFDGKAARYVTLRTTCRPMLTSGYSGFGTGGSMGDLSLQNATVPGLGYVGGVAGV